MRKNCFWMKRIVIGLVCLSVMAMQFGVIEVSATEQTTPAAPAPGESAASADETTGAAEEVQAPTPEEALAALEAARAAEAEVFKSAFTCSVTEANGAVTFGYRAPQDGIVYLFLPQSVDIPTMGVKCVGEIQGVSKGTWDPEAGMLYGAFKKSGDAVVIHLPIGDIQVKVLKSSLPSVQIVLNNTTLETVQKDKNVKYPGNSVYLTNPGGTVDVAAQSNVEFKGRGNSSWRYYDKKGYQIKFDKKTSVLGMKEAKKWILLANASDDSMMRNMVAMNLSKDLKMAYTTDYQYVDLWIDGDYQGTYIIGEKIEIGGNRVNLEDEMGVVMELDSAFYKEEDYWFYDALLNTHFTVKESVAEDKNQIKTAMTSFQQALDRFMLYLYQTPSDQVTLEELSTMIDVDSFAKYYLITEYALNREANTSSFYWYRDGNSDVLHLGPVWDFDTCMGNEDLGANQYYAHFHNMIMNKLLASKAFYDRTAAIKKQYNSAFSGLNSYVDRYSRKIDDSAYMNYIRWNTLGGTNPKGFSDFSGTYNESVSRLKTWLSSRYQTFQVQRPLMKVEMSEDGTVMTVRTGRNDANLRLAVWSEDKGQDDLVWYPAPEMENNSAVFVIDFTGFQSSGLYYLHLYKVESDTILDATYYFRS